jgi:hypothetical protein
VEAAISVAGMRRVRPFDLALTITPAAAGKVKAMGECLTLLA